MPARLMVSDEVEGKLGELIRRLGPNQRLPSEAELCQNLGVSRSTIREVIRVYERSGLVLKRRGIGTFTALNKGPVVGGLEVLRGIPNIVRSARQEPRIIEHETHLVEPDAEVSQALELTSQSDQVVFVRQLYLANDVPIILGESFVPAWVFGDPQAFCRRVRDFSAKNRCLFDVLEEYRVHVNHAVSNVDAVTAGQPVCGLLDVPEGGPLLLLTEVHYSASGKPAIYSRDYLVSSRYRCVVVRRRI